MQTAWAPFAVKTTYSRWATGPFRDAQNRKAVLHKTEGHDSVINRGNWYEQRGGIPHLTILTTGAVHQHYPFTHYSRALRNLRGGVETNTDGAIQIEIVGFTGKEMTAAQRVSLTRVAAWLTAEKHVAPLFPMGRLSKPYRRASNDEWDHGTGWFAHGQVPEQDHGDPDLSDLEWNALVAGVKGTTSKPVEPDPPLEPDVPEVPRLLERGKSYRVPSWPGWELMSEEGVDIITIK